MNPLLKRKLAKAEEKREQELHYLLDSFKAELDEMQKKLENLKYQIEFFGETPELVEKKRDCKVMLQWIQTQFEEVQQSLPNASNPLSA